MFKRRFEFTEGTSSKFWEVEATDCEVTIRYGRIGSDGHEQTKLFDSPEKAAQQAKKLIASKLKKGYREVACC